MADQIRPSRLGIVNFVPGNRVRFTYTNWRGVTSVRTCIIQSFGYGISTYHGRAPCWFMNGLDLDKQERRTYALKDIEEHTMEIF